MPKLSDGTWVSAIFYEEDGEQYSQEKEEYVDCNWSYHANGCGCCATNGPLEVAVAYDGCIRLAKHHRQMAEDYECLAAQAKKEME